MTSAPAPAYYEQLADDRFRATPATAGPWSETAQHGGPPAALLTRAVEATAPRDDMVLARLTFEILGSVPVGELTVRSAVLRPGRSVELVTAALSDGTRDVMTLAAWRIRRAVVPEPLNLGPPAPAVPPTVDLADARGYLGSIEWRPLRGAFAVPGPCSVWTRLRGEVVAGEAPSGVQRVVAVADSGNGVSQELDLATQFFINPELTVHLHREPVGDWVLLDASTTISPGGAGLATSELSDVDGVLGRGAQSLLVAPR